MVNSYGQFADFCRDSGNTWSTLPGTPPSSHALALLIADLCQYAMYVRC